ncbi:AbiV family abortive infection protein [Catenovulum sediminis]|uniref:AbiV family abortive infection protein n=1 Tax=Catenovulum sediminis TaxID=1740262 RepID=A0ABV1RIE8_9ALTE
MDCKEIPPSWRASKTKSIQYIGLVGSEEYNQAIIHVNDLIKASYLLFCEGFTAPSAFLSITILEEMAKVYAGHNRYRGEDAELGAVDLCCIFFNQQCIGNHIIENASDTILA